MNRFYRRNIKKYNIKVITHPTNKGYGASLKTGILASSNENLIFVDGDGQHKTEYIPKIIEELNTYDMVVGARALSDSSPGRKPGKLILKWIAQILTGKKIPDLNSGLRGIKKSVIRKYLHLLPQGFSASTTMTLILLSRGYSVKYIPIKTNKRIGKSTVSPIRDGINTILLILRMIMLVNPMKIFFPVSFVIFLLGLIWAIPYLLLHKGLTVASLFLMLTGVIIFFFGLLADQISQLRMEKYE
ncbi:MAG: glycosyltransferase family 2 protein [Candidatus Neomarinimicrobiota bacterium]|nr:MAG: glycosyltransferase family 2 protein [Candidatus Neomarinimicrobiota bacterium]